MNISLSRLRYLRNNSLVKMDESSGSDLECDKHIKADDTVDPSPG
jgi:hypothetical protein